MNDPSAEMQKAIFAKLTGYAPLTSRLGAGPRIFDKTPATPAYPMIRIGDDTVGDRSNSCMDGWDVACTVVVYSQDPKRPRMDAKEIGKLVLAAIADKASPPTPAGFVVKDLSLVQSRANFIDGGLTCQAVLVVEYLVREAA